MTQNELDKILTLHKKWLNGEKDGNRADLSYVYLKNAYLSYDNLSGASLSYVNLNGANLYSANLSNANLSNANLSGADLSYANLSHTDLTGADLTGADLTGADLTGANLKGVYADETTAFFHLQCPKEGSYIAYKKCQDDRIVKLLIPEDAKRSSATTRKCRASKAKVLSITNINGTENFEEAISWYNSNFIYKIGEIVEVEDFDEDRWNECSTGIHHFITRYEAVNYYV